MYLWDSPGSPYSGCMSIETLDYSALVAGATAEPSNIGWLFHATSQESLGQILEEGLRGPCYLARRDIADYYAEVVGDEGKTPVVLAISLSSIDYKDFEPDSPGIAEPLTFTLGMSEDEVHEAWEDSQKRWEDSLALVGSLRCRRGIPPGAIRCLA